MINSVLMYIDQGKYLLLNKTLLLRTINGNIAQTKTHLSDLCYMLKLLFKFKNDRKSEVHNVSKIRQKKSVFFFTYTKHHNKISPT